MRIALAAAFSAGAAGCGSGGKEPPAPSPAVTINGRTWRVELALTPAQRYQGLSDRFRLDENGGMLFLYPQAQDMDFCMRNCYIPLDIAFLDANGIVVRTYTMRVEPRGRETERYSSGAGAVYALEMNAGDLKKAGVKVGDRATFSAVPDPAKAEPDR